jgi:hypothetical protein
VFVESAVVLKIESSAHLFVRRLRLRSCQEIDAGKPSEQPDHGFNSSHSFCVLYTIVPLQKHDLQERGRSDL